MSVTSKEVTPEQVARCQRHVDEESGEVFYTVLSESDPTGVYTVRRYRGGYTWGDNCPAGIHGIACKHLRWVEATEANYQQQEAARRAALAIVARWAELCPGIYSKVVDAQQERGTLSQHGSREIKVEHGIVMR